ncbi:hypothetical protein, partial [Mesorhizobium sp. M1A.T.Ca.IN.004.03.1.1]|uniref:hypothetical protein n=1 Tax=Mesorhizobium sp. M1A.T.Ca.IN.004.03.1.1 TaxID=2496795 RepID=UPI0019D2E15B
IIQDHVSSPQSDRVGVRAPDASMRKGDCRSGCAALTWIKRRTGGEQEALPSLKGAVTYFGQKAECSASMTVSTSGLVMR